MKKIFSGIQPTGNIHLGNYLGAINNWIDLQNHHNCLFGIMDLHAITIEQDPKVLRENVMLTVATYIACGLDPKLAKIFIQSEVSQHAQLSWVFSTITPLGWLNRMTQFKDKIGSGFGVGTADSAGFGDASGSDRENKIANLGLYSYPVLMASDILNYHANLIPVGDDQKQHIELCRDIAQAFNYRFKCDYFKLPEPLIMKETKRIMSLQDGTKKMSKSDASALARINLNDNADEIHKKIKKSKTDSKNLIEYDENRPEIFNLLNIFSAVTNIQPTILATQYENKGFGKFKEDLANAIIDKISPISIKINKLINDDKAFLQKILEDGRLHASYIASKTQDEVFKIIGLK